MWPDRVSNPGPLTYESGTLPIALRGPAASLYNPYLEKYCFLDIFTRFREKPTKCLYCGRPAIVYQEGQKHRYGSTRKCK